MEWYGYEEVLSANKDKVIVVFGAGYYGQRLVCRLIEDKVDNIVIYDNDKNKWGESMFGIQISPFPGGDKLINNAVYLIAGNEENLSSAAINIYDSLHKYIGKDSLYLIKDYTLTRLSKQEIINNSSLYVNGIIENCKLYKDEDIVAVRSLTYRRINISKLGTTGGPGKMLYTQELLLGNKYNGLNLLYNYREKENHISLGLEYACSNVLGAVEFARQISSNEENVAYIAHDIFSGAGLATNGKKYVLVYHNQGEMVYEMEKFGRKLETREKELVRKLEVFSLKNASQVIFPSKGAEFFFDKTWEGGKVEYKKGGAAYNTLLEDNMKEVVSVDELKKDDSFVTFFSIGQMTESKGIDRIPSFLARLSKFLDKKVRWIVVANGILKENVIADMNAICSVDRDIEFYQFDFMPHEQINYMFSIADVYLMLHRVSIFDLATLEAMYHDLEIVLSDVPGNREYNIRDNIYLWNDDSDYSMLAKKLITFKSSNRKIYNEFFSNNAFQKRYREIINGLLTN